MERLCLCLSKSRNLRKMLLQVPCLRGKRGGGGGGGQASKAAHAQNLGA